MLRDQFEDSRFSQALPTAWLSPDFHGDKRSVGMGPQAMEEACQQESSIHCEFSARMLSM